MYFFHQLVSRYFVVFFEKVLGLETELCWLDWYCSLKRVVIVMFVDEDTIIWDYGASGNLVNEFEFVVF